MAELLDFLVFLICLFSTNWARKFLFHLINNVITISVMFFMFADFYIISYMLESAIYKAQLNSYNNHKIISYKRGLYHSNDVTVPHEIFS